MFTLQDFVLFVLHPWMKQILNEEKISNLPTAQRHQQCFPSQRLSNVKWWKKSKAQWKSRTCSVFLYLFTAWKFSSNAASLMLSSRSEKDSRATVHPRQLLFKGPASGYFWLTLRMAQQIHGMGILQMKSSMSFANIRNCPKDVDSTLMWWGQLSADLWETFRS